MESFKLRIRPEELLYHLVLAEKEIGWQQAALEGVDRLTICYENDLERGNNHEATGRQLCNFLNIDNLPLATDLQRTHTSPYSEIIDNYETIEKIIGQTRYGAFLS